MKYWALFSGGKDSTAVVQWLMNQDLLAGIVSIDTGISTPDWLPFIEKQCQRWGEPLELIKTSANFDDLVLKYGFPGPAKHGMFMNYLKGRAIRAFKKKYPNEMLASGVRSAESARRFRSTKEWSLFEGVRVWAPLFQWTTAQIWEFVNAHGHERSPAYRTLCLSGDCLCGAYATEMERAAIKAFYPGTWCRLARLEKLTGKQWGWGANRGRRGNSPVCVDCEAK